MEGEKNKQAEQKHQAKPSQRETSGEIDSRRILEIGNRLRIMCCLLCGKEDQAFRLVIFGWIVKQNGEAPRGTRGKGAIVKRLPHPCLTYNTKDTKTQKTLIHKQTNKQTKNTKTQKEKKTSKQTNTKKQKREADRKKRRKKNWCGQREKNRIRS